MKRVGAIISLVIILVVLSTSLCFAGTLSLDSTYPADGSKGASIENLGLKLYFDSAMTAEKVEKANKDAFQLYDADGKKIPTKALYSTTEEGVVLVLLDNSDAKSAVTVQGNTTYTLKVSADTVDDEGDVLGTEKIVSFTTLNQKVNTTVNMLMMVVMFGGIMLITSRSAKKAAAEQAQAKKDEKVNPYKEAKKTGKSVEEIVEKDQKDKAKRAAKEAKRAAEDDDYYDDDDYREGVYKVKGPRPISAAGAKYKSGRKAEAEAKAAKEKGKKK